jgi:hypothetical protein
MAAAGKPRQDRDGIGFVARLADDLAVEVERGVGGQHRARDDGATRDEVGAEFGLGARHALHVGFRRLAGQPVFADFRVVARRQAEQQQVEAHADLRQQFAAARASRGKVNAWIDHGSTTVISGP